MTKEIALLHGHVLLVDDEDYERVSQRHWCAHERADGHVYVTGAQYENGKQKHFYLHRFLLDAQPGQRIDHINHNGLDNRRQNLRFCTPSQNSANSVKSKRGSNRFKGASKRHKRWIASIGENGRTIHLGCFSTAEEAAHAYNEAAKQRHGEFAYLNKVDAATVEAASRRHRDFVRQREKLRRCFQCQIGIYLKWTNTSMTQLAWLTGIDLALISKYARVRRAVPDGSIKAIATALCMPASATAFLDQGHP